MYERNSTEEQTIGNSPHVKHFSASEIFTGMTPELPSKLRLQLQVATLEKNWTYSAFWKPAFVNQKKILVWGDGYYNGVIKTYKTIHGMELTPKEFGLQRSQQLRDLCLTLDSRTRDQHASKPFALKVDDLADPEWFFLLSMIYDFAENEGMVGKTAARGQYTWLRQAHEQETAVFTRSLPAKSSNIQTVVCIPLKNGVLEFGTSEDVPDDSKLVQSILAFFMEPLNRTPSKNTVSSERKRVHSETTRQKLVCAGHLSQLESSVARSPKRVKRSSFSTAETGEAIPLNNENIQMEPSCEGPRISNRCDEIKKDASRPNTFHAWKKNPAPLQKCLHPEKL